MIAYDKKLHLIAGFGIALISSVVCGLLWNVETGMFFGAMIAFVAGCIKEVWDHDRDGHEADIVDAAATTIGGIAGATIGGLIVFILIL